MPKYRKKTKKDKPRLRLAEYTEIEKSNNIFESYYIQQNIVNANEWDVFMSTLRIPLPIAFRFVTPKDLANRLIECMKDDYFSNCENIEVGGKKLQFPYLLDWYPNELGWQHELGRHDIRNNEPMRRIHNFLVTESNSGFICRQEAVSMVPPFFMDIKSHHYVLDMCAAPGSKTAQLIEMLHDGSVSPPGLLIANDVDNKRSYTMTHQLKRFGCPSLIVSNHNAVEFPSLYFADDTPVLYDRILCDVPCSGDGTMRKNLDIWKSWNTRFSFGLHELQLKILDRAIELVKIHGKIVYSTCSFNPIENEAVICAMLKKYQGKLRLCDCSDILPKLKRNGGLCTWKVLSKLDDEFQSFDAVPNDKSYFKATMFPPGAEEGQKLGLQHCMRLLPHYHNSGGFFIAVLEKCAPVCTADDDQTIEKPPIKKPKFFGRKEDPFVFIDSDADDCIQALKTDFDVLPNFEFSNLLKRHYGGKGKKVYYASKPVKEILNANGNDRFKVISGGVQLMSKATTAIQKMCLYRLSQDGIHLLHAFITKRKITFNKDDLEVLLKEHDPKIERFSENLQNSVEELIPGSIVIECEVPNCSTSIVIAGWKGKGRLSAYVKMQEKQHYLRILGIKNVEQFFTSSKQNSTPEDESSGENNLSAENG